MIDRVLPLGFLQVGRDAVIKGIHGGRSLRYRIMEMGLVHGSKVKVVKNDMAGPLIIALKEGRLAIGRGMALKILVEET